MQGRVGPNRVGPLGLGQPFADVIKLLIKEVVIPQKSNRFLFDFCGMWEFFLGPLAPLTQYLIVTSMWIVIVMISVIRPNC